MSSEFQRSSRVLIWLLVGSNAYEIHKIGPDRITLVHPQALPKWLECRVLLLIEDRLRVADVVLTEGSDGSSDSLLYRKCQKTLDEPPATS